MRDLSHLSKNFSYVIDRKRNSLWAIVKLAKMMPREYA
jgi:hypothetical protein